LSKPNMIIK